MKGELPGKPTGQWDLIYRPNRSKPRVYTPADLKRIVCLMVSQGQDRDAMRAAISHCLPGECVAEEVLLRRVLELAGEVALAITLSRGILAVLSLVRVIVRRLPGGGRVLDRLSGSRVIEGEFEVLTQDIQLFLAGKPPA